MISQVLLSYMRRPGIVILVIGALLLSIPFRSPGTNVPLLLFVPVVAFVLGFSLREQLAHSTAQIIPHYNSVHVRIAFVMGLLFWVVVPLAFVYETLGFHGWLHLMPGFLLLGTLSLCISYFFGPLGFFIVPVLTLWAAVKLETFTPEKFDANAYLTIQGLTVTAAIVLLGYLYHRARVATASKPPFWHRNNQLRDMFDVLGDGHFGRHKIASNVPAGSFSKLKLDSILSLTSLLLSGSRINPWQLGIYVLPVVMINIIMPDTRVNGMLGWLALFGAWGYVSNRDFGYELLLSVSRKTFVRSILLALFSLTLLLNLLLFGAVLLAGLINREVMYHIDFGEARYSIVLSCALSPALGAFMARSRTNKAFNWSRMLALWIACSLLIAISHVIRQRFMDLSYLGLVLVAAACILSAYRTLIHADFT
ncbi:MAG: hypothetical protein H6715_00715 [Myxococcales bacterium]|nr:hypothetical protein [Myxococcales bacterium]MCB9708044.1 hypothetical protein [Myxococcales bacterium]